MVKCKKRGKSTSLSKENYNNNLHIWRRRLMHRKGRSLLVKERTF